MANGAVGGIEIGDVAGLHAQRPGMAKADHFDRMGASPQHILRRNRLEPCNHADRLAGSDIERRHQSRTLWRDRLHLRGDSAL